MQSGERYFPFSGGPRLELQEIRTNAPYIVKFYQKTNTPYIKERREYKALEQKLIGPLEESHTERLSIFFSNILNHMAREGVTPGYLSYSISLLMMPHHHDCNR